MVVTWEARAGSRVRRHSTIGGMLIAQEDLRALRPDARPSLTRGGLVRRSVLELCDGNRTIADIERELYARHPSLFESQDHASAFAAEVLGRFSTPPS
jgi:hypothetical protein